MFVAETLDTAAPPVIDDAGPPSPSHSPPVDTSFVAANVLDRFAVVVDEIFKQPQILKGRHVSSTGRSAAR
jgi:hypothetical protein